ncbi:hypothetical protein OAU26_01035 [Mariniblastus sp.]|nr:hypothetical protein [Mariniblastus sp.]
MLDLKAYILCRFAKTSPIYTSWMSESPLPVVVVDEYLPDWPIPADAGILITHMHYRWEELTALRKVFDENQIPILILSDGILEYRNTWEHPDLVDGSLFQPVFGHKLACIGNGQARVVESWGNLGKCEVVGLPRLDGVSPTAGSGSGAADRFRLLVATASTPAFDESQRKTVFQSMKAIKDWSDRNPVLDGRSLDVVWRLSDGLESELGVGDDLAIEDREPLSQVLDSVDAVLTTPSTIYLESVLRQLPTAWLDFHNSPQYISSAWTISSSAQIDAVVSELAAPPRHKMVYQNFVLHDQLASQTPATPRLLRLIQGLVEAGCVAREKGIPLTLPAQMLPAQMLPAQMLPAEMLPAEGERTGVTGDKARMAMLYPENEVFESNDPRRLQIELSAAIKRLEQLPYELAEKNKYIAKLMRSLDRSRERVEEMHNRVVAIRKRFGVEPVEPPVEGKELRDDG